MSSSAWETVDNLLAGEQGDVFLVDGEEAEARGYLGGGGSKEVYDIDIDGSRYALGIMKFPDPEKGFEYDFWAMPSEPEFIERARDAGIQTYDNYERAKLEIEGQEHPAFLMTRDQDHQNPVYDSKNAVDRHDMLNQVTTRDQLLDVLDPLSDDIAGMIAKDIPAGRDSFNISEVDSSSRVFYTDPPTEEIQQTGDAELAGYYSDYALTALLNTAAVEAFDNEVVDRLTGLNAFRDSVENAVKQRAVEHLNQRKQN